MAKLKPGVPFSMRMPSELILKIEAESWVTGKRASEIVRDRLARSYEAEASTRPRYKLADLMAEMPEGLPRAEQAAESNGSCKALPEQGCPAPSSRQSQTVPVKRYLNMVAPRRAGGRG